MKIAIADYWMGRDISHATDLTDEIRENAEETVRRVNLLLDAAESYGVDPGIDKITATPVASGWRPAGVNARTKNAATGSSHLTGEGCDVQDDRATRRLARWCLQNLDILEEIGLWMEDPQWTGGPDPWVHLQIKPPRSGNRVYIPSSAPPIAGKLPEQVAA